ncbi:MULTISPECIES: hypothetical protein [Kribbella]|uniref:Uncharacterized protein n=1 Tax=Kribbella karoonensis TaxID=324851 RepID=A0ABN2D6A0_9ACTN
MAEEVSPADGTEEPLEPDAILMPGEGHEGRGVNADEAYPGLESVKLRGGLRRRGGAGGRGGAAYKNEKQRGERDRDR